MKNQTKLLGLMFLLPILFYGLGESIVQGVINQLKETQSFEQYNTEFIFGILFMLFNSFAVLLNGILVNKVILYANKTSGKIYIITRIFEAIVLSSGVLAMLSISGQYSIEELPTSILIAIATKVNYYAYQIAMLGLGVGSIALCLILFQSNFIPKYITLLGLIGYPLLALGSILELFAVYEGIGLIMCIPGGLFELAIGIYLLLKKSSA